MNVEEMQIEIADDQSTSYRCIEELPAEIFILILDNIKLKERLKLRSVCKSWLKKINNSRSRKLFTSKDSKNFVFNRHKNDRADFNHHFIKIHPTQFHLFINKFRNSILKTLKDLRIFVLNLSKVSKKFFETIGSLEHLESLVIIDLKNLDQEISLCSNSLKFLEVEYIQINDLKMILETPRLKQVKNVSSPSLKIDFKYPQSLETLELDRYCEDIDKFKFTNLKHLFIRTMESVSYKFLSNLESLQILSINGENIFDRVFAQKTKYKRHNLMIYLTGLQAESLNEYECMVGPKPMNGYILTDNLVSAFMKYHSRLADDLMLYDSANYNIADKIHPTLEDDLFKRLTNLQSFYIDSKVKDELKFIKFTRNIRNITCFTIKQHMFSQRLLNRLPVLMPYIQAFSVIQGTSLLNYDIDFIFKFKYLLCGHFDICFNESKKTLKKFFELKYFWGMSFKGEDSIYFKDTSISISVDAPNRLTLGISYANEQAENTFDEYKEKKYIFDCIYDLNKFLEVKELIK